MVEELDMESRPVNIKNVYRVHAGVSAEEYLLGLSLLSGFADIARIYGDCPAIGVTVLDKGLVERYPVKLLP